MIAEVLALVGATLTLIAAIGATRFPDALTRMHALTKASTVGLSMVALGAAFALPTANDVTSAILAAVLYSLTLPISAFMIARATYITDEANTQIDTVDQLADQRRRSSDGST